MPSLPNRHRLLLGVAVLLLLMGAFAITTVSGPDRAEVKGRLIDRTRGLVFDGMLEGSGACAGMFELTGVLPKLCTPGPDPAPPGVDVTSPPDNPGLADPTAGQITCTGNGTDGPRVQALYVVASDRSDRFSSLLPNLVSYASAADGIFNNSAALTGGSRRIRWVTNPDCSLSLTSVVLPPSGDDNFSNTIQELKARGFNRSDRKYMLWVDANVYCGLGNLQGDDQPGAQNRNNTGPHYGRTDTACWGGRTEAHELMHNLGGVQLSAPNTSRGWHCTDESDLMCYSDHPDYPPMRSVCPSDRAALFDCTHDDYFNTAPAPGSYLATHWNTFNSAFLTAGGSTSTTTTTTTSTTTTSPTTTTTTTPTTTTTTTRPTTTTTRPCSFVDRFFRRC